MATYNDKILVPNTAKDGLDTIHPETNTGNVYDFKNNKWLNESLEDIKSDLKEHEKKIASTTELGHIKVGENLTITSDGTLNAESGGIDQEELDKKANKKQENWITATLSNGFSGSIRYFKDEFGIVHINGYADKTVTSGGGIFTLPTGYRADSLTRIIGISQGAGQDFAISILTDQSGLVQHAYTQGRTVIRILISTSFRAE